MRIQTEFKHLSHRDQLGAYLNDRGLVGRGVEVGTFQGDYAAKLLETWRGDLACVDPWLNQPKEVYFDGANLYPMEELFRNVMARIGNHPRCQLLRMMSVDGALRFADDSLDFVYLDGNHALDYIRGDIRAWWPKVRIGGVVSGHDFNVRYDHETNSDALTAVCELAEAIETRVHVTWCTSWFFTKTAEADQKFRAVFK